MNPALPDTPCYLNGEWGPVNQARVSVLDRGFILGEGIGSGIVHGTHALCAIAPHAGKDDADSTLPGM